MHCPIRGKLKAHAKAKDGLTFTEEKLRIDCIKHLLSLGYPTDRIKTETVILQFGHKGALQAELESEGADIIEIVTYRWGLPEDTAPLLRLIGVLGRDEIDLVAFTSASQRATFHRRAIRRQRGIA